jgi:hypothetical protein
MGSRAVRRRSTTAVGVYTATALGVGTTIAATKILGGDYAQFAIVFSVVGFFQMLLDLTVDEALIKYGFRYVTGEDWGRLRRLFELALGFKLGGGVLALVVIAALAPARTRSGARTSRRRCSSARSCRSRRRPRRSPAVP